MTVRKKMTSHESPSAEQTVIYRMAFVEILARKFPLGKPLHDRQVSDFHGFNEYKRDWYFAKYFHVLGLMLFFIIFSSIILIIEIVLYLTYISKELYIFFTPLFVDLGAISSPIVCLVLFCNSKPRLRLCQILSYILLVVVILKVCIGILWLCFFISAHSSNLNELHAFRRHTWTDGLVVLGAITEFICALLWYFARRWNNTLYDYLFAKDKAMGLYMYESI